MGEQRQTGFSWARPDEVRARGNRFARWRRRFDYVSWPDIAVAIAVIAVFDLVIGLVISGYFSTHCRDICTLHQQAHQDRMLLFLVPILLGLPPVLLALWIGRLRVLIAAVQAIVCAALMTHAALDLRTVNSHINGTARCWSDQYSAKNCPWGPV
jgi:H+/Cl- antiporter ClcA